MTSPPFGGEGFCYLTPTMEPDSQLIHDCLQQDRKAQARLYRECFGLLMGICQRYYRNHEEAVAALNLGFLKILNNLRKKRPEVPFQAWICRIMINTIIDDLRKSRNYRAQMTTTDWTTTQEQIGPEALSEVEQHLDVEGVREILYRLPPATREVFNLFAIDGYSHAEIAALLGISVGTSKWHVSAARKQLIRWIKDHRPDLVPHRTDNE